MHLFRALLLGLLAAPSVLHAASFNCAKAASSMEKLICGDAALSALDDKLQPAYAAALARVGDKALVRQWQRDWLASATVTGCQDAACLAPLFTARIKALDDAVASPWNGQYQRMNGRQADPDSADIMLVAQRDGSVMITGSAVRIGPNGADGAVNYGELDGRARLESGVLVYRDDECEARFTRKAGGLQGSDNYQCGGHNVTFGGQFARRTR